MNSLKEKLAKIKKEALSTQTDVEEKRKNLDVEQQQYIGLKKDTKTKEGVLESLSGNKALEDKKQEVEKSQSEIEELQEAWVIHREELEVELRRVRRVFDEKRTEVAAKEDRKSVV